MSANKLFAVYALGNTGLKNRVVMAPMTRCRAIGNLPNEMMEEYYAQRAGAGLIISEAAAVSPHALGYARMPGIFNQAQTKAWKSVAEAVHARGGHIFMQLMHTGRISHPGNQPADALVLAPSAVKAAKQLWTDGGGMQDAPVPKEMSREELEQTKAEYVQAAQNAIAAGFDGVELHGANGYLLEQFLSPFTNIRNDEYGGSIHNRARFVLETVKAVREAVGKGRVGIRLSPYGVFNDMSFYLETDDTYTYLAEELNKIGIAYIHLADQSSDGGPEAPRYLREAIRRKFEGTLILCGGYTKERAEQELQDQQADLIAFGRPFINNPDLVYRLQHNRPLSDYRDTDTFYSADEKGYIDYPAFREESIPA